MKHIALKNLSFINIIKSVLLGMVVTLVGVLLLAVLLKFFDLPIGVVGFVNCGIKIGAIFLVCLSLSKRIDQKFLISCVVAGLIYALLNYVIFSIINAKFSFGFSNILDLVFALAVAVISSVIVSLFKRKTA